MSCEDPASPSEVVVEAKGGAPLKRLHTGECFGELALIKKAPRNATVRCDAPRCKLLSMDVDAFSRLMRRSASVHDDIETLAKERENDSTVDEQKLNR